MSNTYPYLTYANTFAEWVDTTNYIVYETNNFDTKQYHKKSGTLVLDDTTLGLQVSANAVVNNTVFTASLNVSNILTETANTMTTGAVGTYNIDTFDITVIRSGEYDIQMSNGSMFHKIKVSMIQDNFSPYLVQYGEIYTNTSLASFDAHILSGVCYVTANTTSSNTTFNIVKRMMHT